MGITRLVCYAAALALPVTAAAQDVGAANSTFADGVLVTSADVTTCPYRTLGTVSVNMRLDLGGAATPNIYRKMRVKAKEIGADAVVLVSVGNGHVTLFSFNQKNVTGRAIQYVKKDCAPTS